MRMRSENRMMVAVLCLVILVLPVRLEAQAVSKPGIADRAAAAEARSGARRELDQAKLARLAPASHELGGFNYPSLPSPAFQVTEFNVDEGARNDSQGRTIRMSANAPAGWQQCPYRVLVHWDAIQPAVEAAPFYPTEPESSRADLKYPVIGNLVYFRPPVIANPGFQFVSRPNYNAYVYLMNCRNEYSNALPFRIHPTAFQVTSVSPEQGFIADQQVAVRGTGLAGTWVTDQRVMFYFKFGRTNAAGTGVDYTERTFEAEKVSWDERTALVRAPSVAAYGYTRENSFLAKAEVYVVRGTQRSNAVPIRYCSSAAHVGTSSASCF